MRKLALLFAIALTACVKANDRIAPLVDVCIRIGGAESGVVKTSTAEDVQSLLASSYPTSVSLRLKNSVSGVEYTAKTGEQVTIPIGNYSVTGRYKPTSLGAYNGNAFVARNPSFSISATLAVQEGKTDYSVPAAWESFALCVDKAEVSSWLWYNFGGTSATPPVVESENTALFFVCGQILSGAMRLDLTPADLEHFSQTSWWIASTDANLTGRENAITASEGAWYRVHPDGVVTESGTLSLAYPDWVCGKE